MSYFIIIMCAIVINHAFSESVIDTHFLYIVYRVSAKRKQQRIKKQREEEEARGSIG